MGENVDSTMRSRRLLPVVVAVVGVVACSKSHNQTGSASRSEPVSLAIDSVTATDTVKAVDYGTRTVTLESPNGATETHHAGPNVNNFDQIHVGDKVRATVTEALAVRVRKAGTPLMWAIPLPSHSHPKAQNRGCSWPAQRRLLRRLWASTVPPARSPWQLGRWAEDGHARPRS